MDSKKKLTINNKNIIFDLIIKNNQMYCDTACKGMSLSIGLNETKLKIPKNKYHFIIVEDYFRTS